MKMTNHRRLTGLLLLTLSGLVVAAQPGQPQASRARADDPVITNSIGMKLALIPAGKFLMGSPPDEAERNEGEVQHAVTITKPFYLGVYEVTQREYHQVMGNQPPPPPVARAHFEAARGGGPDHPMENVRWTQAVDFCQQLSERPEEKQARRRYRLPTEAEWEYACRAGTTTAFHYGQALSAKQANFNGSFPYGGAETGPYLRQTTKVGSYAPNAFGLYDMHGNVWEWCSDWYDPEYYRHSPKEDPQGPPKGIVPTGYKDTDTPGYGLFYLVIRGGCWIDEARACRSAHRFRAMPNEPYRLIGLRVVCEVEAK
jgi:formylglycine-generating enzyme required for sulfatase activity